MKGISLYGLLDKMGSSAFPKPSHMIFSMLRAFGSKFSSPFAFDHIGVESFRMDK